MISDRGRGPIPISLVSPDRSLLCGLSALLRAVACAWVRAGPAGDRGSHRVRLYLDDTSVYVSAMNARARDAARFGVKLQPYISYTKQLRSEY